MADKQVNKSTPSNTKGFLLSLAFGLGVLVCFWLSTGLYRLDPGQQALIYTRGKVVRVVKSAGVYWHLPAPFGYYQVFAAPARFTLQAGGTSDSAVLSQDGGLLAISYQQDYTLQNIQRYAQVGDADVKVTEMRLQAAIQMALHQVLAEKSWLSVLQMQPTVLAQQVQARARALFVPSAGVLLGDLRVDSIQPLGETKALFLSYQERQTKLQEQLKLIEVQAKPHYPLYQKQADALLAAAKQEVEAIQLKTQADIAQLQPLLVQDAENPTLTRAYVRNQPLPKALANPSSLLLDTPLPQLLAKIQQTPIKGVVDTHDSREDPRTDRTDRSAR